jgi:hypothetical protein
LAEIVLKRSFGNAAFCVEFISYLLQSELLQISELNVASLLAEKKHLLSQVPMSVEQLILSRVDRLQQNPQLVLKSASVFGYEFRDCDLLLVLTNELQRGLGGEEGLSTMLTQVRQTVCVCVALISNYSSFFYSSPTDSSTLCEVGCR